MNPDIYLRVREKEGRLYTDDIVAQLPSFPNGHPLAEEWRARSASVSRLTRYLSHRHKPSLILELGCGNGWLSNLLSQSGHFVIGTDVNHFELKQAKRVFHANPSLSFMEVDIHTPPFRAGTFDAIVLASVIQYFEDLPSLLQLLLGFLRSQGEIHIIDSPLYANTELQDAELRSKHYFSSLGFPEMAEYYFHHRFNVLNEFKIRTLYQPNTFMLRVKRRFGQIDSPFPWIVINR